VVEHRSDDDDARTLAFLPFPCRFLDSYSTGLSFATRLVHHRFLLGILEQEVLIVRVISRGAPLPSGLAMWQAAKREQVVLLLRSAQNRRSWVCHPSVPSPLLSYTHPHCQHPHTHTRHLLARASLSLPVHGQEGHMSKDIQTR